MEDEAAPKRPPESLEELPAWVRSTGAAVWVSGPDHRVWFVNRRAEGLLGAPARSWIGRPCNEVLCGEDKEGQPFCSSRCAWFRAAQEDEPLEPQLMQVSRVDGSRRWVQVVGITVRLAEGQEPWIVHLAVDMEWSQRLETYLRRVASRSQANDAPPPRRLTQREYEVLGLLAKDLDLPSVASQLHLSRVTIRNHVQHILGKLQVHSIQEAVALFVLGKVEPPDFRPPGGSP